MTPPRRPSGKVLEWPTLLEQWGRPRTHRLVFTNGCFDLLHPGHVHCLDQARRLGDALVVAVNTDDSVRRLKGENRPWMSEQDRVSVLAALESVDAVAPPSFDQDTPKELIAALLPDVLAKGGDYELDRIVGAAEVRAAGGEVVAIPFLDGYSTSDLMRRIEGDR